MFGFRRANTVYYYAKNLQGDVIAILNSSMNVVAKYTYDSWGKLISIKDNNGNDITNSTSTIGYINPIRYRSYYYDNETGLYYLKSRYYDPEIDRFINADRYVSAGQAISGFNMYVYCNNNPISNFDPNGKFVLTCIFVGLGIGALIGGITNGTSTYISAKEKGLEGKDLFLETLKGAGKGALVGSFIGALLGISYGAAAIYGVGSLAANATLFGTGTILTKAYEVSAVQARKSYKSGKNGAEIINDIFDSIINNSRKIVGITPFSKSSTTVFQSLKKSSSVFYSYSESQLSVNSLYKPSSGFGGLAFFGLSVCQMVLSVITIDPDEAAARRGFIIS